MARSVVPPDVIPALAAAIGRLQQTERLILDPARRPGFDFNAFVSAWETSRRPAPERTLVVGQASGG